MLSHDKTIDPDLIGALAASVPVEFSYAPDATIDLPSSAVALFAIGSGDTVVLPSFEPSGGSVLLFGSNATIETGQTGGENLVLIGAHDSVATAIPFDVVATTNNILALGNDASIAIGAGGADRVTLNGANDSVVGAGFPGTNDMITANGMNDAITLGGTNHVQLDGTGATVQILPTIPGDLSDGTFGSNTVSASGSGTATVTGAGEFFSFAGGSGTYSVGGGNSTEHSTISGGSGGGSFTGGYFESPFAFSTPQGNRHFYGGDSLVESGTLRSTLTGGAHGGSTLVANGSSSDLLVAGEYGNDTLSGGTSTGNNVFEGFTGARAATDDLAVPSVVINAGAGNDTLVSGDAAETLAGGGGNNIFRFLDQSLASAPAGGGNALITDFARGRDLVDLSGFHVAAAQILSTATVAGGSTIIGLPNGETVNFKGVAVLTAHDFTPSS